MFAIYHLKSLKVLNYRRVTSQVFQQRHLTCLQYTIVLALCACCAWWCTEHVKCVQERISAQDKFLKQTIKQVQVTHANEEDVLMPSRVVEKPLASDNHHSAIQVCMRVFHTSSIITTGSAHLSVNGVVGGQKERFWAAASF